MFLILNVTIDVIGWCHDIEFSVTISCILNNDLFLYYRQMSLMVCLLLEIDSIGRYIYLIVSITF